MAGAEERGHFVSRILRKWLQKPPILTSEMESPVNFAK